MLALTQKFPPVVRAAVTSCTVMSAADVVCQLIQQKENLHKKIDWSRTARFAVVGLTLHGPYFHYGFKLIDKFCGPSTSIRNAMNKASLGQVTVFPVYLSVFFLYMGQLEGRSWDASLSKVKQGFAHSYLAGSFFWPFANVINFKFVPTDYRITYINVMGLLWNAYLSSINSKATGKSSRPSALGII